jgi:WD40 repeat protein
MGEAPLRSPLPKTLRLSGMNASSHYGRVRMMRKSRRQFLASTAGSLAAGLLYPVLRAARADVAAVVAAFNWPSRTIHLAPDPDQSTPPVVTAVRVHRNGEWLATAGDDHIVRVFSLVDGKQIHRMDKHTDWVRTVDYSPSGKQLASAGNDRFIHLWDAETGKWEAELEGHEQAIAQVRYSHGGKLLATAGFQKHVHLYDIEKRKLLHELAGTCPDMRAVAFAPNDELLAVGGRCGTIRTFDTASGEKIRDVAAHKQRIRALAFSQDGNYLASAGEDRTIHITPTDSKTKPYALDVRPVKFMSLVFYGPHQLAVSGSDNIVRLWDVQERQELGVLLGHTGTVSALDSLGKTLISAGYDTTVRIWTVTDQIAAKPGQRVGARKETETRKK